MSEPALSKDAFSKLFDQDQRLVNEFEFRKAIFRNGVSSEMRDEVWRYLFQFYSLNSTSRERVIQYNERLIEYHVMKTRWKLIQQAIEKNPQANFDSLPAVQVPFNLEVDKAKDKYKTRREGEAAEPPGADSETVNLDYIKIQTILRVSRHAISNSKLAEDIKQIEKDIERTGYVFDDLDKDPALSPDSRARIVDALRNVLITFAAFNQSVDEPKTGKTQSFNLGYTQGMNEFASVFIDVFEDESVAYWCFSNFMLLDMHSTSAMALNTTKIAETHMLKTNVAHYFSDLGVKKKLCYLSHLLRLTDPALFEHLKSLELDSVSFCHEWLLLLFKRCFRSTRDYLRCFEMLNSHFIELHTSAQKSISIKEIYSFDMFICLSLVALVRDDMLVCSSDMDVYEHVRALNKKFALSDRYASVVASAEEIFHKYCIKNSSVPDFGGPADDAKSASQFEKFKRFMFS